MVQIDVPVAFAVGSLLADAARRQIEAGRKDLYYRALVKNNMFQIFFFSWIPVYFIANYFGWETTYLWWHAESVSCQERSKTRPVWRSKSRPEERVRDRRLSGRRASGAEACAA